MTAAAIERAQSARVAVSAARAKVESERQKLVELKLKRQQNQADRERLRSEKEADDAQRLIDGEDAVPMKPRRDGKLAKLDRDAAAETAAIKLQEARLQEAEAAAEAPQIPFVAAILELAAEVQGDAVGSVRATLAELAPHFAALIAGDQIRAATIGDRFPIPSGANPPLSGVTVASAFTKEIPARLRPAELSEQTLFAAAHEISAPIMAAIKES